MGLPIHGVMLLSLVYAQHHTQLPLPPWENDGINAITYPLGRRGSARRARHGGL